MNGWSLVCLLNQSREYYEEIRWRHMELVGDRLDEMGLYQEANISRERLKFQRNEEQQYIHQLQKVVTPAEVFVFHIRIWNPKNWIVSKVPNEEEEIPPYPFPREAVPQKFSVQKFVTHTISSDHFLWRWRLLVKRVETYFWNGLYIILYTNLLNGPHGVRAMSIFQSSFHYVNNFDYLTGKS